MSKFRASLGLPDDYRWETLEYGTACNTANVRAALGTLGQPGAITATPWGIILRVAEGADAIANLIRTGDTDLTGEERGQAVVCAIAQLGGLIFSVFATTIALLACICAPIGASVAVCVYRIGWGQSRRAAARRKALQSFQQGLTRLRRRRRAGPTSTGAGAAAARVSEASVRVPVLSQRRRVLGLDVGRHLRFGFERLPGEPEFEAHGSNEVIESN